LRHHPAWTGRNDKGPDEGVGIAFGGWPAGTQPASAACRLNDDGSLSVMVGSADISGTKTGMVLLAAEAFGVAPEKVRVITADTDVAPYAGASGGSKITYTVGAAVAKAAAEARRQVLEIADGLVRVKGVPDRGVALSVVAEMSMAFGSSFEPILGRGRAAPPVAAPAFVAHLARVRVDRDTGAVQVLDYVSVQDVGKIINPAGIQGQVLGGVTQGLGWALYERMAYDDDGRLRTATFADYALPSIPEMPPIESILVEVPSPEGPLGARGVGEPPIVAGAAAIANAIFDATGVRPTELPMTPETVLQALQHTE
jgi:CO/xanthine dehydrogenase Mo-binding subunit